MSRILAILLLSVMPATAQQAATVVPEAPDMTEATDVVPIACNPAGEGIACTVKTDEPLTFCMAVDAAGEPLANSTGATDSGEILFQNVDASQIAGLRCR